MVEWHLPPDYIVNNWTDELLDLMVEKFVERKERRRAPPPASADNQLVPESVLFARGKNMIEVIKK